MDPAQSNHSGCLPAPSLNKEKNYFLFNSLYSSVSSPTHHFCSFDHPAPYLAGQQATPERMAQWLLVILQFCSCKKPQKTVESKPPKAAMPWEVPAALAVHCKIAGNSSCPSSMAKATAISGNVKQPQPIALTILHSSPSSWPSPSSCSCCWSHLPRISWLNRCTRS